MNPVHFNVTDAGNRPAFYGLEYIMTGAGTGGSYFLSEAEIPKGDHETPLHIHTREDETFMITSGELQFEVDGHTITAKEGSCVFIPKGIPHRFYNASGRKANVLILFVPAGIEKVFEAFEAAGGELDVSSMNAISQPYGTTYFEKPPL